MKVMDKIQIFTGKLKHLRSLLPNMDTYLSSKALVRIII